MLSKGEMKIVVFPKESILVQYDLMVYYILEKRGHSKISKFENDTKFLDRIICPNDRDKPCKIKAADEFWPKYMLTNILAGKLSKL